MTCDDLLVYLSSYIDDELDDDLVQAAREHLATCQNCRVVLNTTQHVVLLGRGQGQRVVPAAERTALYDRLREAFLQRPRPES